MLTEPELFYLLVIVAVALFAVGTSIDWYLEDRRARRDPSVGLDQYRAERRAQLTALQAPDRRVR